MKKIKETIEKSDNGSRLPIVEHFYSLQGEGSYSGAACYFIRLAGCDIRCPWCDSMQSWDASKYPMVDIEKLIEPVLLSGAKHVVITGGEPTLFPLGKLVRTIKNMGIVVHIETTGTNDIDNNIDWITLSPKRWRKPLEKSFSQASELKVVIDDCDLDFEWAEECALKVGSECNLFLQPQWNKYKSNVGLIVEYIKQNPKWRMSVQSHKFMDIQ